MEKTDDIRISVVIPSYNRADTIKRCLDSVLNQTVLPYEIIVADDGSTDNTLEVIGGINNPLIKVYSQENKGAQAARNLGIKKATGNYIAFLDSDDEWVENKLELQLEVIRKNPNSVIYSGLYIMDEETGEKTEEKTYIGDGDIYKRLLIAPSPTFPSIVAPKAAIEDVGLLDESTPSFQEWDCSLSLAKKYSFIYIDKPLFIWHVYPGDRISNSKKKEIKGYTHQLKKYSDEIESYYGAQEVFYRINQIISKYIKYVSDSIIESDDYIFDSLLSLWIEYGIKVANISKDSTKEDALKHLLLEQNKTLDRERIKKELLLSLMKLKKEDDKRIKRRIEKYAAKKIAIYGMDPIGIMVRDEFLREGIDISYCIDKRGSVTEKEDYRVYFPDELKESPDLIVVTAIAFFEEIKNNLENLFHCPIISIEELVK